MRSPEAVAAMLCPVCKVGLHMSDRQGVEIDYCPQCRGVWLDRGELDKIIERSGAETAPPAPQAAPQPWGAGGYEQRGTGGYGERGYDPRYHKKRKKSFLEDLFD
ncbi:hypothetical protein D1610_04835 [Sphingomonas gilva]|uniref:Transcription factor zinc-finger domain-containing protein n=1 Tax=Sphingomonas gilva TaxID=2305907 RepID=A0A396RN38_9SPHN|nr:zf-TFIIB domain-containing protein [Sphingomonas gilva]RHW17850.1 hypothetical protein D1610_04835 [Sphingomonas gilva]